jgi:hypothetical protein
MNHSNTITNRTSGAAAESSKGAPLLVVLAVTVVALGGVILFFFNPQQHGFYPFCTFYRMTGLLCPGCGSLRAIHELLHGNLLTAFRLNPLLVASIPIVLFWAWKSFRRRSLPPSTKGVSTLWLWIGMGLLIGFGIARNLPFF